MSFAARAAGLAVMPAVGNLGSALKLPVVIGLNGLQ